MVRPGVRHRIGERAKTLTPDESSCNGRFPKVLESVVLVRVTEPATLAIGRGGTMCVWQT